MTVNLVTACGWHPVGFAAAWRCS